MQTKLENPNTTPIEFDEVKYKIRALVDSFYDIQKLRIQVGNRICASFRRDLDEDNQDAILKTITSEYGRITDVLATCHKSSMRSLDKAIAEAGDLKFIKSNIDYQFSSQYIDLCLSENKALKTIDKLVKSHPMWDLFFKDVVGCGPLMAAICLAYLDVHEARYVSSFWAYAGVGTRVDETGNRVAMSKRTLVEQEYVDKDGNVKTKKGIGYHPFLHTKLLGVLGDSFIKKRDSVYRKVYDDYKNRYQNRPDWRKADGSIDAIRCHRAAIRQAIKAFLKDLWVTWRTYEGYTIPEDYAVAHLNIAPHGYNEADGRERL